LGPTTVSLLLALSQDFKVRSMAKHICLTVRTVLTIPHLQKARDAVPKAVNTTQSFNIAHCIQIHAAVSFWSAACFKFSKPEFFGFEFLLFCILHA
jgi:hypothetical protein